MFFITLATHFILEAITIIGIFSGIVISKNISHKILYLILSITLTLLWAKYGAPKSPAALIGIQKFTLEIFVYSVGTIAFFNLFGYTISIIYLVIVILNLFLIYLLGLH